MGCIMQVLGGIKEPPTKITEKISGGSQAVLAAPRYWSSIFTPSPLNLPCGGLTKAEYSSHAQNRWGSSTFLTKSLKQLSILFWRMEVPLCLS